MSPDLLQTEEYTREFIRGMLPSAPAQLVERRVEGLRRRRARHHDRTRTMWVILDEAVLHRRTGSQAIMRNQLEHLLQVASTPMVTLQVLPYSVGTYPGMSAAFVLLDFPHANPALFYTDTPDNGLLQVDQAHVRRHRTAFYRLAALALSPSQTITFIAKMAEPPNH